jgi:hypothetical protein
MGVEEQVTRLLLVKVDAHRACNRETTSESPMGHR